MPRTEETQELIETLADRCDRLRDIFTLQGQIAQQRDSAKLPALIMTEVTRLLNVDRGTLFLYENATHVLRTVYADGLAAGTIVVPLKMGLIGTAIVRRQSINTANAYEHVYFNDSVDAHSGYRTDSLLAMPVIDSNARVLGGIQVLNKSSGHFTAADEAALAAAAARLAAGSADGRIASVSAAAEMDALLTELECDRGSVFQLDEKAGLLESIHASHMSEPISLRVKLGIAGLVALTGQTLVVSDPTGDDRFDASFDKRTGYHTRNILCVPLKASTGESLGVIQVINRERGNFTADDIELLETIAGVVAISVENGNLVREIDHQFHSLLEVMAASLDARDELTAGHSHRVTEIAMGIAATMGFAPEDLDILKVAAMLHDYGKIGVDDAVLRKNGKLDDAEYRHMKTHASSTHEILEKVRFARKYRSVPLVASSHHEALDGSGYPRGLSASEIPFMAKVLTVADVFEALTADRHYRKGMREEEAFAILDAGIGTKFDVRIVAALKQLRAAARPS